MIPILGARIKEQLDESLAASDVKLSADQLKGWMKSAPSRLGSRATLWPENLFDRLVGGKLGALELPATTVA